MPTNRNIYSLLPIIYNVRKKTPKKFLVKKNKRRKQSFTGQTILTEIIGVWTRTRELCARLKVVIVLLGSLYEGDQIGCICMYVCSEFNYISFIITRVLCVCLKVEILAVNLSILLILFR